VLDLLEWQVPSPAGTPAGATELGFSRLGLTTSDIDALYARVVDAGVTCFGEPHEITLEGAPPVRAFVLRDPDGTLIEAVSGADDTLSFVSVNCTDLDASVAFYRDVAGFTPLARFAPGPASGATLGLSGEIEMEMAYLAHPEESARFAIDLQTWRQPRSPAGRTRAANELGISRMALLTDDIDRDDEVLREHGVACVSPPAELDMGPGLPALRALLFPDPDGAMLELIESP
jgi:catechol 2,3-dioxygenase-like lactoylglutathione lyase family enzyme